MIAKRLRTYDSDGGGRAETIEVVSCGIIGLVKIAGYRVGRAALLKAIEAVDNADFKDAFGESLVDEEKEAE